MTRADSVLQPENSVPQENSGTPAGNNPRPLRRMLLASHSRGAMIAFQLSSAVSDLNRAVKERGELIVGGRGK